MKPKQSPPRSLPPKKPVNSAQNPLRKLLALLVLCGSSASFALDKLSIAVDPTAQEFTVALPANPSTGFQWFVDAYDTQHFDLLHHHYVPSGSKRSGSVGKMLFIFRSKDGMAYPTATHMTFRYLRTWEKESAVVTEVKVFFKKLDARPIKVTE